MGQTFRDRIIRGDLLLGTIITLPSPEIAEIFSLAGFDWLFVDLEHSAMSIKDAQMILQSASPMLPCLIRVPVIDEVWIKKSLDIGSSGIIIPQVMTASQAETSIRLCKYPPVGTRSVGIARAHGYGEKFQEYTASANSHTAVIIQIEHIDAVDNIEEILKVPGIDCIFVGPYDLSASMGKTGQTSDAEVQLAIARIQKNAEIAKIPLGIFGSSAEAVQPYIERGYTLIAAGMDTVLLGNAARSIIQSLR